MAIKSRKPWKVKLNPDQLPRVVQARQGRMLVPSPMLVAESLRRVPTGKLITPAQLRARLARKAGVDITCPMTTGIFLSIVAGATEEALAEGRRAVAPYWRVVDEKGRLPPKFPPGRPRQAEHLRAEGHRLTRDYRVANVTTALVRR